MTKIITTMGDKRLSFIGRIERGKSRATLCWCGSQIALRFRGTTICLIGENDNFGSETYIGAVIDGQERSYKVGGSCKTELTLAEGLEECEHEIIIYKRMEGHYFTVSEVITDGELLDPPEKPQKRIEVYGDSVSAGSVVDALDYVGKSDPEDNHGQWDNAWHAYPRLIAEMLPAEVYDTSQGGIAIFDRTGYFEMPDTRGVESCYNKVRYSSYRPMSEWDFSFRPHVVIMAVGQNDAYPDPDCLRNMDYYEKWVGKYIEIIESIRSHAPRSAVVLALTVLQHDPVWDDALEDIANRLGGAEKLVYHFRYTRCGKATPGHPRYPEQVEMATEMTDFLKTLPPKVWQD